MLSKGLAYERHARKSPPHRTEGTCLGRASSANLPSAGLGAFRPLGSLSRWTGDLASPEMAIFKREHDDEPMDLCSDKPI